MKKSIGALSVITLFLGMYVVDIRSVHGQQQNFPNGGGSGSSITLQTNGTNNGSQSTLNLTGGSNVTVTDNGSGTDTIALTGLSPAPNTIAKVTSQWLDSYNQGTGNFTQSQPTVGDLAAGTNSTAIAASTPFALFNAAVITGLTGTTNRPLLYRDATGNSEPTTWSTNDIFIGHNAAASNCSSFLEQHSNGGGINFRVDCSGGTTVTSLTSTGNVKGNSFTISNVLLSGTAPSIATGGCGGSGATISLTNGTAAFDINVGTTPTAAGCTITMPAATNGWICQANDMVTISTSVFIQKQTGTVSTTSVTIQNFSDVAVATAPTASDVYHVSCVAH